MVSIDCMEIANERGFQCRVKYFMQLEAVSVVNTDVKVADYNATVLAGTASIYEMAVAVLQDSEVMLKGIASTDAQIGTAVAANWNALCGVERLVDSRNS